MKECPSCGVEVPTSASRCKECFHDFDEAPPAGWGGPLLLLATIAFMAIIGAGTFYAVLQQPLDSFVQVDQPTKSVVYITQYRSGPVTKRLMWSDISRIEHTIHANGRNEIAAYDLSGERWVINEATEKPLKSTALDYEETIGKPLVTVDNTRGFQKNADRKRDEAEAAATQAGAGQ